MSISIGSSARVDDSFITPSLGTEGEPTNVVRLGREAQKGFKVQVKDTTEDFAVTDSVADIDRLVIDKTTGNLDTNGGDMTVSTLNYTALNPPVGGGGGVNNPMTANLDLGGFDILGGTGGSVGGNSFIPTPLAPDTLPPNPSSVFKPQLVTGFPSYIGAGQDPFNSSTSNFPTQSTDVTWANGMPVNAKNSIIGRRTGVTITPGNYGNQIGFGNKITFQDYMLYDPNGLRHAPVNPAFFTAAIVKPYTPIGILEVHTHLEGQFLGAPGANSVSGSIEQFRAGAPFRSYKLFRHECIAQTEVVSSASRFLMGFAPYSEDFQVGDYFEIHMGNDASSVGDFALGLFKAVLTFHPSP